MKYRGRSYCLFEVNNRLEIWQIRAFSSILPYACTILVQMARETICNSNFSFFRNYFLFLFSFAHLYVALWPVAEKDKLAFLSLFLIYFVFIVKLFLKEKINLKYVIYNCTNKIAQMQFTWCSNIGTEVYFPKGLWQSFSTSKQFEVFFFHNVFSVYCTKNIYRYIPAAYWCAVSYI